jgi:hypothetical protein
MEGVRKQLKNKVASCGITEELKIFGAEASLE